MAFGPDFVLSLPGVSRTPPRMTRELDPSTSRRRELRAVPLSVTDGAAPPDLRVVGPAIPARGGAAAAIAPSTGEAPAAFRGVSLRIGTRRRRASRGQGMSDVRDQWAQGPRTRTSWAGGVSARSAVDRLAGHPEGRSLAGRGVWHRRAHERDLPDGRSGLGGRVRSRGAPRRVRRDHSRDIRASFVVARSGGLPHRADGYGSAASLLALNFFPIRRRDPRDAVAHGGAGCGLGVRVGLRKRHGVPAVVLGRGRALDPAARVLDEGERFPLCRPATLVDLFQAGGLGDVRCEPIAIPTTFSSFDDYWRPSSEGPAPLRPTSHRSRRSAAPRWRGSSKGHCRAGATDRSRSPRAPGRSAAPRAERGTSAFQTVRNGRGSGFLRVEGLTTRSGTVCMGLRPRMWLHMRAYGCESVCWMRTTSNPARQSRTDGALEWGRPMDAFLEAAVAEAEAGLAEGVSRSAPSSSTGPDHRPGHNRRCSGAASSSTERWTPWRCRPAPGGGVRRKCSVHDPFPVRDVHGGDRALPHPTRRGRRERHVPGEEDLLEARGVAVDVLQDARCIEMMRRFIRDRPTSGTRTSGCEPGRRRR